MAKEETPRPPEARSSWRIGVLGAVALAARAAEPRKNSSIAEVSSSCARTHLFDVSHRSSVLGTRQKKSFSEKMTLFCVRHWSVGGWWRLARAPSTWRRSQRRRRRSTRRERCRAASSPSETRLRFVVLARERARARTSANALCVLARSAPRCGAIAAPYATLAPLRAALGGLFGDDEDKLAEHFLFVDAVDARRAGLLDALSNGRTLSRGSPFVVEIWRPQNPLRHIWESFRSVAFRLVLLRRGRRAGRRGAAATAATSALNEKNSRGFFCF